MDDQRVRAGTGTSGAREGGTAGREAAEAAVAALGGEAPALVVVYTTPRYDLRALLHGVRSVTGEAVLVGATSSGQIVNGKHLDCGVGVAVLAMTAGSYRFGAASASHIGGHLDQAGQSIARESRRRAGASPHGAVVLLADPLLGDLQQLVQGIYRITGPGVPTVGAAADDEFKFVRTFVFHGDDVVEEGAVALWIGSDHPLQIVTRHGWQPIGLPLLVTRVQGTEIMELGGAPAALVYEEQLGLPPGTLTPENFWDTSILHPIGLLQPDGSVVIRDARFRTDAATIRVPSCGPPAGSAVQVMTGNQDTLLGIVPDVIATAVRSAPGAGVVLAFSCAARATILGPRVAEEARLMQEAAGEIPTFGMYGCGEFARVVGVLGTHNATLNAVAL